MRIIPVLDLKNGSVVAAREGRRESYPPLISRLTDRTDPASVIDALRALHDFETYYLADLDALMGGPTQWRIISRLADRYRDVDFWLDQGVPSPQRLREVPRNIVPVIGTESLAADTLRQWVTRGVEFILSLDFRGGEPLGDASTVDDASLWPDRVIVMSLSHVGSGKGPDFARLRELRRRHPERRLIAAGGVRDAADIAALAHMGLYAALVSSALHSGAIDAQSLKSD